MAYIPIQNTSVSGTVQTDVRGSVATVIIGGSIAASTTPAANQSVSGTVQADIRGSVATVIIGGSILTSSTPNQSVSGTVNVGNFPTNTSVSGTVVTTQGGTWISSIVNIVPSSVIVGASIFGLAPVNVTNTNINVSGSVIAFQGAGWSGSVAVANTPSINISSIGTANGALPVFAPLTARVQGVADLRVVQGASVAAIAAQGAGVRTYINHVQVVNFGPSSVLVVIADNTTSILGWTIAPAGGGSNYDCFYRPAANSPITASINGTASVLVSLQGFTASI